MGDEWWASRPDRAFPPDRTPGTLWTGGWVGLRFGLDTEAMGQILFLYRDQTPAVQSVARHYTTPAPSVGSTNSKYGRHRLRLVVVFVLGWVNVRVAGLSPAYSNAVWACRLTSTFRRNVLPPSSNAVWAYRYLQISWRNILNFRAENGGRMFLLSIGIFLQVYMAS
jgi:hypothetical protein